MAFVYVLTDRLGNELDELPGAYGKRVNPVPLNGMATAAATVRLDHPFADTLIEADNRLKVYETGVPGTTEPVLHFHGEQITGDEVAGEGSASVAATFADPLWTIARRLIGQAVGGYSRGTALAPVDRGTIISELLAAENARAPTGLRLGNVLPSSSTYVAGWYFKPFAEALVELSATLDGPDFRIRPIEYDAADGAIAVLDVLPAIGALRPDAAFEYGDGLLNVKSYTRAVSKEGSGNRIISLPPGYPDNAVGAVLVATDAASIAKRGLLEALVSSELNVDVLRQALVDYHRDLRGGPRQTISFQPVRELAQPGALGRVPRFGVDYANGDVIPFRASVERELNDALVKVKRIDVSTRVRSTELAIDTEGAATPTLTVVPGT